MVGDVAGSASCEEAFVHVAFVHVTLTLEWKGRPSVRNFNRFCATRPFHTLWGRLPSRDLRVVLVCLQCKT